VPTTRRRQQAACGVSVVGLPHTLPPRIHLSSSLMPLGYPHGTRSPTSEGRPGTGSIATAALRTAGAATSNTLLPSPPRVGTMPIQRLAVAECNADTLLGFGKLKSRTATRQVGVAEARLPYWSACRETKHSLSCRTRSSANKNRVSLSK